MDHNSVKADIVGEYESRTARSRAEFERFCRHLPGGETRSITFYAPYPVVVSEGRGGVIRDLDGNEYLDVLNNYTALVHGHAFAPAVEAARAVLEKGTVFPAPHLAQLELAETLTGRYPAVERVRFTNSGTEASLLALRIARAETGRRRVVFFEGGYHGSLPEFLEGGAEVVSVPYNDADALGAIDAFVAAVIVEPFLGSGGVIPAEPAVLRAVEERCREVGALLVLDEVQALRNAFGGMHSDLGLRPDLVLMGKIIGGGFPIGAVGGRAGALELTSVRSGGSLSHSGTFNGNIASMSAGCAALAALDAGAIAELNARAERLAGEISAGARRAGVPVSVTRSGSIMQVHLAPEPPRSAAEVKAIPARWTALLHIALLLEGVYCAPRGMLNLSTALDELQLKKISAAYEHAFEHIAPAIAAPERAEP